ncbi:uncharacterized protein PRCAT00002285001 [Priceomyces carsonii]|uniref:uncharacterized protein n=1 Tax=Priceomyces carsonii TaxID=28549 RepID=UPI002EDBB825|nr:unnamed protein product [Priceomyces carsonii]
MNDKFSNLYYSPDYRSGIDALTRQSLRSIQQVHELRSLIFKYMNYYHTNSALLNKVVADTLTSESSLKPYASEKVRNNPVKNGRSVSGLVRVDQENMLKDKHDHKFDSMATAFDSFLQRVSEESAVMERLAMAIDVEVLERISTFIKVYEPQVRTSLDRFEELLDDYNDSYAEIEDLRVKYADALQRKEFEKSHRNSDQLEPQSSNRSTTSGNELDDDYNDSYADSEKSFGHEVSRPELDFPLHLGPVTFSNEDQFSRFLNKMISNITTVKRKLPIPGYRNEIFSSEQICEYLKRERPNGLVPARANLEKFGQGLIDLNLMIGTGILGSRKFKSESMFFEWSDLSLFVSNYSKTETIPELENSQSNRSFSEQKSHIDQQGVNDFAQNASKKFNGLFSSMKLSLKKNSITLDELEDKYTKAYIKMNNLKRLLDLEISNKTQMFERFEKLKIDLFYQSLAKVLEVIYNFSLKVSTHLHSVAVSFKDLDPKIFLRDFDDLVENFSTGIYFPSTVSPYNLTRKRLSTNQTNNSYQNLKFQFNLYKDITLQPLHHEKNSNQLLSLYSAPEFLYSVLQLINETTDPETDTSKFWLMPLDHQKNWILKQSIINLTKDYRPTDSINVSNEYELHMDILNEILELISKELTQSLINFLKNWLLEIGDSVIPCAVFDTIVRSYSSIENDEDKKVELVKVLNTIPRSNLCSLIMILEHICRIFDDLSELPAYGYSDELIEDLLEPNDIESLRRTSSILNAMDQIGAVPFLHLILRPSLVKNSNGFRPPLELYNNVLSDLLDVQLRSKLFKALLSKEKSYKSKLEKEKNIQLPKLQKQKEHTKIISATPKPLSSSPYTSPPGTSDSFTLRPFRTGISPAVSPISSPRHTPKHSMEVDPLSGGGNNNTRSRNNSASILKKNIDVEFEDKR